MVMGMVMGMKMVMVMVMGMVMGMGAAAERPGSGCKKRKWKRGGGAIEAKARDCVLVHVWGRWVGASGAGPNVGHGRHGHAPTRRPPSSLTLGTEHQVPSRHSMLECVARMRGTPVHGSS